MIVVAQGTPGAGKTSTLLLLREQYEGSILVDEIYISSPAKLCDAFFLKNDLAKTAAARAVDGLVFIDRDFTSTLAFVRARDGAKSFAATSLKELIDEELVRGNLIIPDLFLRFYLEPRQSLSRQNKANAAAWASAAFVEKADKELDAVISEYIPKETIVEVDACNKQENVLEFINQFIGEQSYEATSTS